MFRFHSLLFTAAILILLPAAASASVLCGDCNSDGLVNGLDATLAAQIAGGLVPATGLRVAACDVDGDGPVTILDAQQIANPAGVRNCPVCGDCRPDGVPFTGADCVSLGGAIPGTSNFAVCDMDGDGAQGTAADFLGCTIGFPATDCALCGDCELDGDVDIVDALVAAQIDAMLIVLDPAATSQRSACDVNVNGAVDILDAQAIAQAAAGIPGTLNCPVP